jgi:hypothetical protein
VLTNCTGDRAMYLELAPVVSAPDLWGRMEAWSFTNQSNQSNRGKEIILHNDIVSMNYTRSIENNRALWLMQFVARSLLTRVGIPTRYVPLDRVASGHYSIVDHVI